MLLTHLMPHHIIIRQLTPLATHLRSLTQRCRIQIRKDFEAEFGGEGGEEIDLDEVADRGGDEGELGEAALGEDALEHEVAVFGGGGGGEGPDVGYGLLVGLGEGG